MNDKELIKEVKRTIIKISENDPEWRLDLGNVTLSAPVVIQRLNNDKKFRKVVINHYLGLAVEMEQRARGKIKPG